MGGLAMRWDPSSRLGRPMCGLRDNLPKRFPQLRIWTYGYRSELTDERSTADVFEYAKTFKQHLCILRQKMKVSSPHQLPLPLPHIALFKGQ